MSQKNKVKIPSIRKDMVKAFILTLAIVLFLSTIYLFFGEEKLLDSRITALFGAILAFSGLMAKQYLLKENIAYLNKWKNVEQLIDEVTISYSAKDIETQEISENLSKLNNQASAYMGYVVAEIKYIPVIPLLLVVLYGAALIASGELLVSIICLILMLILVAYLALATITSNNLSIDTSHLDETIQELEELIELLKQ